MITTLNKDCIHVILSFLSQRDWYHARLSSKVFSCKQQDILRKGSGYLVNFFHVEDNGLGGYYSYCDLPKFSCFNGK